MKHRSDGGTRAFFARSAVVTALCLVITSLIPSARAQSLGCTFDPSWGSPDDALAADVYTAVNQHRVSQGLDPFQVSVSLTRAAEWKAGHMAATGLFNHDDPGRSWEQRIQDCGYEDSATENIGFGFPTAAEMVAVWLGSSGHVANIEHPDMVATGVAAVRNEAGLVYWVQVFGTQIDPDDIGSPPEGAPDPTATPTPGLTPTPTPSVTPPDTEVANTPPVAVDDVRRVRPRQRKTIVVLANDSDPDGDPLLLRGIVTKPRRGRAIFDPTDGTISYRARRGTAGHKDRLTYRVADGNGGTDIATVRLRIHR